MVAEVHAVTGIVADADVHAAGIGLLSYVRLPMTAAQFGHSNLNAVGAGELPFPKVDRGVRWEIIKLGDGVAKALDRRASCGS